MFTDAPEYVMKQNIACMVIGWNDLTLFIPGEGRISPLIVYHVTTSIRNRVKNQKVSNVLSFGAKTRN